MATPKRPNKRRRESDQPEDTLLDAETAVRLLRAMELIDTQGVLDTALKTDDPSSLRALLQHAPPPSHALVYQTFIHALSLTADALTQDYSALEDLKTFAKTFSSVLTASLPPPQRPDSPPDIPTRPRYVLHRSLANGVDLFSHAAPGDISQETLKQFNSLRDTDLLAVHDSIRSSLPHSSLDSISRPTKARPSYSQSSSPSSLRVPSQTATLYYSPFSSFAPSYDSSGSSEPYSKTMTRRSTHAAIAKWFGDLKYSLKCPSPEEHQQQQQQQQQTSIDPDLMDTTTTIATANKKSSPPLKHNQNEQEDFSSLLHHQSLLDKESLDAQLQLGNQLLRNLQIKQWQRLRLDRHLTLPSLPGQDDAKPNPSDIPDEAEQAMANMLLKHLVSCIPRTFGSTTSTSSSSSKEEILPRKSLIPPPAQIRQLRRRIIQPRQPIYQGLLDSKNASGVRESLLNAPPQAQPPQQQQQQQQQQQSLASYAGVRK